MAEKKENKPAAKKAPAKKAATKPIAAKKPTTTAKKAEEKKAPAKTAAPKVEKVDVAKEVKKVETPVAETPKKAVFKPTVKKDRTLAAPSADFDWASVEDGYSKSERDNLEKIYNETLTTIQEQDIVEGTVTGITPREVFLDINYKSEGIISLNETKYNPDLRIGDKLEVFVEIQEDKNGQLILSHSKARALGAWDKVNGVLESGEIIKGYVKCRTKGGLIVDVFGIEAFLPGSQIDVKPIRDYDIYVGKNMEFKVVKINNEFKNVVVSHKALIEAELEEQKKQIISKLEKGQVLEGVVKNVTSYGVFIDLGGVDGLIHITDLSWGRISHPEEIVKLDQKINVVILDFDDDKKRIALGLKQLQDHPWDALDSNLSVGDKVKGKVVVMADYGAFIEIQPGVEGLIHVSEMSWSNHLKPAQEFFKVGDELEAVILTLDREDRKMSLGVKQLTQDPWDKIVDTFAVGSRHKGKVTNISDFGVFVELGEGIDGLIHISDLSWTKKVNHPSEITKVGEKLEVVILEIDRDNKRLSLGYKQLEENPWEKYESIYTPDSIHQGTVGEMTAKAATVILANGVEGFCMKRNLEKEDGSSAVTGDKLDFKVVEFNKDSRKILLSHSAIFREEEMKEKKANKKSTNKAVKQVQDNIEKTTLGDLGALSALKDEFEDRKK